MPVLGFDRVSQYIHDYYYELCLLCVCIGATLCGPGNALMIAVLCLCLSIGGLTLKDIYLDPYVLSCWAVLFIIGGVSNLYHQESLFSGYSPGWTLYLLVYLFYSSLKNKLEFKKMLLLSASIFAGVTLFLFYLHSIFHGSVRFDAIFGNANAMGIFLVLAYFLLLDLDKALSDKLKPYIEVILLTSLSMTLSMGSFLSLIIGLFCIFIKNIRVYGFFLACRDIFYKLTRVILCFWIGAVFYLSASFDFYIWLPILAFILFFILFYIYRFILEYLKDKNCFIFCSSGLCLLILAIYLRPSSFATFFERIKMWESGFFYLLKSPLLGVGQYAWRGLDFKDGGIYFNTWHIHNLFLHIGVELGLVACVALFCLFLYHIKKPGMAAFFVHSLLDIAFFYSSITLFGFLGCYDQINAKYKLNNKAQRAIFLFFVIFSSLYIYFIINKG